MPKSVSLINPFRQETVVAAASVSLMFIAAVAVFNNGGYFLDAMTFCVVSIWLILAVITYTEAESLWPISAPEKFALISIAALWLWSGTSMLWSIAPDLSWNEFNRSGAYFACFAAGLILGRFRSASIVSVWLLMALALITGIYALGVKLQPDIVANTGDLGRISVPLGYPNALGLLVALPLPAAIYLAAADRFWLPLRAAVAASAPLMILCLFFTLSRGAMGALAVGLIVYFAISPIRLRSFFVMLLVGLPGLLLAIWSSGQEALMADKVDLPLRIAAAEPLRFYTLVAIATTAALFVLLVYAGRGVTLPPSAKTIAGAVILSALLVTLIAAAVSFAYSKQSVSEWAKESYRTMTQGSPEESGAGRLFEFGLSRRWKLWEEAVANWQENPIIGSGAQSFPLVHLRLRESGTLFVRQPHGLPFRLLTELGLVGLFLGTAFIAVTQAGSALKLYRSNDMWERGIISALISMNVIYLVHTSFDWDWNMLALTMIYFLFNGIVLGWRRQVS